MHLINQKKIREDKRKSIYSFALTGICLAIPFVHDSKDKLPNIPTLFFNKSIYALIMCFLKLAFNREFQNFTNNSLFNFDKYFLYQIAIFSLLFSIFPTYLLGRASETANYSMICHISPIISFFSFFIQFFRNPTSHETNKQVIFAILAFINTILLISQRIFRGLAEEDIPNILYELLLLFTSNFIFMLIPYFFELSDKEMKKGTKNESNLRFCIFFHFFNSIIFFIWALFTDGIDPIIVYFFKLLLLKRKDVLLGIFCSTFYGNLKVIEFSRTFDPLLVEIVWYFYAIAGTIFGFYYGRDWTAGTVAENILRVFGLFLIGFMVFFKCNSGFDAKNNEKEITVNESDDETASLLSKN
ncbi:hypothetical protein TRFO_00844 [Tritrichomonas foetus]|uniref:Uncharacterized protein n=1 Tax=Tritrichomonas foetus TaxID=1144522 RepID=A0A1J4L249_9EUKA|nr:hypothetical protein TRFO_00844 [Tritrichomonas foetus]|eukprot:OHT17591.1 hypothetical protein TRFO_00844 [Tritrichomonas foetus]